MTLEASSSHTTPPHHSLDLILAEAKTNQSKSDYDNQIKAAFYYQVAWAFCDKELKKLSAQGRTDFHDLTNFYADKKEKIIQALALVISDYPQKALTISATSSSKLLLSESKTSSASPQSQNLLVKHLLDNPYKEKLQHIRAKAADLLKAYKKHSTTTDSVETKAESKSIGTMQEIYRELTTDMKQLIRQMIADCMEEYHGILGHPPCDYAFFGLGSMAHDEMTPYSDLEFGILIAADDKGGINKTYFQNITKLLHLKIINLGETTPRIMGVKLSGVEISNIIPNGLSFDGAGPGGCKNPFGRKDKFTLLGTPQTLADYQDQKYYDEKGILQDERFLPASLAHVTLIAGGKSGQILDSKTQSASIEAEALLEQYKKAVRHMLDQPATELWGNPLIGKKFTLRQARALELLLSDLERFSPKLGKVETDGRSFAVKHDLYRLPNTLLDQLALYYGLEAQSLWEQITQFAALSTESGRTFLNKEAAQHLRRAVDSIGYHRLSAYLHLGEQNEEARLSDDKSVVRIYGENHQDYYTLPGSEAFAIYYCLIPLWQAVKRFRDSVGHPEAFQASCPELYSESSLIKGRIKHLLQGAHHAVADYKEAVGEAKQLAESLSALGMAQLELRQYPEAESTLKEAQKHFNTLDNSAETAACLLALALTLKPQGKTRAKEAQYYLDEATVVIQRQYGKRHPYFAHCVATKAELEITFRRMASDWHIPLSNDETFVGREALLKQLSSHFVAMEVGQRLLLSAVSGLGGVGKTTLAIQYLHHSNHPYELRVWFRAESAATLSADYRDFAVEKGVIKPEDKIDIKDLIVLVKQYLEKHTGWLAVYDNVENYEEIKDYLPAKGGHVLISTRRQEWPSFWPKEQTAGWNKMEVDVFTLEEALSYLKKFTGRAETTEEASMKLLAEELGRLPLALAQAAAYIKHRGITVADYLDRYQQRKRELLADKLLPADSESLPVASTWDVSLTHILDEEGLLMSPERSISWSILQAMSYLHSEDIPCALLARWLQEVGNYKDLGRWILQDDALFKDAAMTKQQLETALKRLQAYSLVHYHAEKQTVSLHRVVQTVMRERFDLQPRQNLKEAKETKSASQTESKNDYTVKLETIAITQAISQAQIAHTQAKQGQLKEAEQTLRDTITLFKRYDRSYAAELSKCYLGLAIVLVQKEKDVRETKTSEEIAGYLKEAQSLVTAQYGAAHPLTARCAHVGQYLKTPLSAGKRALWNWKLPEEFAPFVKRNHYEKHFHDVAHSFDPHFAHTQAALAVLLGLAGIGKTTVANHYVHQLEYPYDLRIWFQADNPPTLLKEYRTFANALGLLPLEEKSEASEGEVLYAVKSYLECYPDWLVVYDNAASYRSLKKFLPTRGGHILVTTRRREWQDVAKVTLEINELAQEMQEEDAKRLVKLWDKQLDTIQQEEEQAKDKPLSRALLHFMLEKTKEEKSLVQLPRALLEKWILEQKAAGDVVGAKIETDKALGYLQNYLLVSASEDRLNITIHPLMLMMMRQGVGLDKKASVLLQTHKKEEKTFMESKGDAKATTATEQSFHCFLLASLAYSSVEEFNHVTSVLADEKREKSLLPHLQALVKHHDASSGVSTLLSIDLDRLLGSIGYVFLGQLGDVCQAKLYYERALKIKEKHYGKDHWQVAITLNNQGEAYGALGDAQTKKTLLERALKIKEQHYGKDHWEVAITLNNLATAYGDLGDAQMKKTLSYRALKIFEQHYGKDHWQLASPLNNLATACGTLGYMQEQKTLLDRAVRIFEQHYGKDHWQVASPLNNLAIACGTLGYMQEQKTLSGRAVRIFEKHYGKDHWQVASALGSLAIAYGELGDAQTGKQLLERALKIKEQHYGKDHWQTTITLNNLANAYGALGDTQRKKELLEQALTIQEQYYGKNHLQVAITLHNLATAYGGLSDAKTAIKLLERALKIKKQHYGKDHLEVVITLNNLTAAYDKLEDISTALSYAREAYRVTANFKNLDHPYIQKAKKNFQFLESRKLQQDSLSKSLPLGTKGPSAGHKATTTITDTKTDTIIMALEARSLDYVQRLQQVVGAIPNGTPIVQHGKKSPDSHWVSFSTFWLKQLPPKAIEELSEELHISKEQFQCNGS